MTLFFGPEPIEGSPEVLTCVFNVKKRSWKAGIQVAVEISGNQLTDIARSMRLTERLEPVFATLGPEERSSYEDRVPDLFAQAVSWCKLDIRLQTGLTQENQRIPACELVQETEQAVDVRREYVLNYVLTELDLAIEHRSPSSS